ncbi:GspH/FimT family pseudopilin [Acidovorax sp. sic0104]|uniref:GspH/FimT family pseudopilin n=1 Tax=Acidovorax sp. sic0104 TaxID=2854784 RepID=UPI001C445C43|nr:GspH/FimT family pseudopilin [Acidovorax sp. sic0104]MBV7539793.1 GspH/FimT family pseudopilin [Acidovorax sp. sic0104]
MLKKTKGFTLIELMVTISIVALMLMAVVPSVAAAMQDTRARGIAEHLLQGLNKARIEAIKHNRAVTFSLVDQISDGCSLSSASGAWVVSMDDPAGRCGQPASTEAAPRIIQTFAPREQFRGVTIQGLDSSASTAKGGATFNGYGQLEAASGALARIDISHSGPSARLFRIEVSPAGGVRLCDRALDPASGDPRACVSVSSPT